MQRHLALLGIVSQGNARYNYLVNGTILKEGAPVARSYRNEEYDRMWKAAEAEMDPVKRAALFVKMNDLVIQQVVVIPVVARPRVAAISSRLRDAVQSPWDSDFWALAYWSKA